ncbi:cation:proton antiporter [Haloarcula sp. S1CR25-12]|uniref:Cation:proton antiporter n=1 Tax=Haloarcula saliterrae TaxID=2950534 RepID=A0ABU2F9H8_9EURY|nr:cation:proton antiporter [Haloarcula sp. S1CR25-12]MDS0258943.1 cation:proton antiporter [Haloarcula sp. S1CR25-12]
MSLSGVEAALVDLVLVFALAGTIAAFAATSGHVPYTIALVLVGLAASLLGFGLRSELTPELLSDLILFVLVPALLFQGASRVDADRFVENVGLILGFAVVGLPISVALLGLASHLVLGFPLLGGLLFAAIVLPTDPVAVLPLFEELGVPARLSVLVDGESMLNDGVGVVLYTAFLELALESPRSGPADLVGLGLGEIVVDLALGVFVSMVGGVLVGAAVGIVVYRVFVFFDDELTTIILSVVLAYGSFLAGELLGVSGVVAVVSAGVFVAERRETTPLGADTRLTFSITWRSVGFVANTFLFLTIGLMTPFDALLATAVPMALTIGLVFLARAVVVYPLAALVDRSGLTSVPRSYRPVLVWSGIHVSIPLALALGLPAAFPAELATQFQVLTFGVAMFTLVVQGLTMEPLLHRLGVTTATE